MLNMRCTKLLLTLCLFFSLQTKSDEDRRSVTFLNASERALQKTIGFVGKATAQTLGFVWHHPLITLSVTGAALISSPAARGYIKSKTSSLGAFLWEKGKEIASRVMTDTTVMQETRRAIEEQKNATAAQTRQLDAAAAASKQHGEQLERVENGVAKQGGLLERQCRSLEELREKIMALIAVQRDMEAKQSENMGSVAAELENTKRLIGALQASYRAIEQNTARLGDQAKILADMPDAMKRLTQVSVLQLQCLLTLGGDPRLAAAALQENPEVRALMAASGSQLHVADEQQIPSLAISPEMSSVGFRQSGVGRGRKLLAVGSLGRPGRLIHDYTMPTHNGNGRTLLMQADDSAL
jgi:hypothetical protein